MYMLALDDVTHSKVDRGEAIENDEDVVISQLGKTKVHSNYRERDAKVNLKQSQQIPHLHTAYTIMNRRGGVGLASQISESTDLGT